MDCVQVFMHHRNLLFSIAYRMSGLVMDAEDLVQETFLKWHDTCSDEIESPKSYLTTMITRLSIDHLRSAKVKREEYIGPWLPAPLFTDAMTPEQKTEKHATLSMAFLLILERLSPFERAVFILREVFEYGYAEIASIVEKSEANCRQIMRRARTHIEEDEIRFTTPDDKQYSVLNKFLDLAITGDVSSLLELLTDQAVSLSDGGGKVTAARRPVVGAESISKFFIGLAKLITDEMQFAVREVNGQPAIVISEHNKPFSISVVHINPQGYISNIYSILNPDKLEHL